jgi:hypothetical protein
MQFLTVRRLRHLLSARAAARLAAVATLFGAAPLSGQITVEWVTRPVRPGDQRVIVLLKNGASPARDVQLSWVTRDGRTVQFGDALLASLAPNAETAVNGTVPVGFGVAPGDSLLLRVDYTAAGAPHTRFSPVGAHRTPSTPPLKAQVIASSESLVEYETRRVLLQLTNAGPTPLRVGAIHTRWPEFIRAGSVTSFGNRLAWPLVLQPAETQLVTYDIRLHGRVRPGKHFLVFDVPVAWTENGVAERGNLVVTAETGVAVLGESEILKVLTLPSLLFVPGFLVLVVLGLLWNFEPLASWRPPWSLPFKPSQPEFWVLSITVSIAVWAAALLIWERNYLERYNASDVVKVWVVSLLAGILLFTLIAATYQAFLRYVRSPLRVLDGLARRDSSLVMRRVKFRIGGEESTGFLIEDSGPTAQTVLLAPPIRLRWRGPREQRQDLESALAPYDLRAAGVAKALRRGKERKQVEILWRQTPLLTWPTRILKKDVSEWRAGRDLLLQVEPEELGK